jgi:hypothetical protein
LDLGSSLKMSVWPGAMAGKWGIRTEITDF